jgi:hypothetical protein
LQYHKEKAMRKFILAIAVVALTLTIASTTEAGPKSGGSKSSPSKSSPSKSGSIKIGSGSQQKFKQGNSPKINDYHLKFGTKFDHGYFYKGKNHHHWGLIRFDVRYGCNCYWDPCLLIWFYWCERDVCYYPVSYCPYRCYACTEVVVETPCLPCTSGQPVLPASTDAPPVSDIPPIPAPVAPRSE